MAEPGSKGQVHWFNRAWLDYTGTTLEQNRGSGWQAVHHPDYAAAVVAKFEHHVRENLDWEDTFPLRGKDGQYRWFLSRMNVIRDEAGKVTRIFGTNTDITTQRAAEQALRDSKARLEVALEAAQTAALAKDKFLASLSHELRTPLTPVLIAVSLLMDDENLPPPVRESLRMIGRNIEIQVQMINDLLDLTRIASNKLQLQLADCDMNEVVRGAVDVCAAEAASKGVVTVVRLNPALAPVRGDTTRLQQVIWNLIQNAIKFTPAGGSVTVMSYAEANRVCVEVADTGYGIEAHLLERIFDPFEQGDEKSKQSLKGLGLGLAIARRIVQAHGGALTVVSEGRNRGAALTVAIPCAAAPTGI
jgi:PAS domain S-box-containing protein